MVRAFFVRHETVIQKSREVNFVMAQIMLNFDSSGTVLDKVRACCTLERR
jgi:hypothetical protein